VKIIKAYWRNYPLVWIQEGGAWTVKRESIPTTKDFPGSKAEGHGINRDEAFLDFKTKFLAAGGRTRRVNFKSLKRNTT